MKKLKIIIPIIVIIVVLIIILMNVFKKEDKIVYQVEKIPYEYFVLYGKNTGVVDKKGNIVIEEKYNNIYIPNPSKDVFVCFTDDEYNYEILNKKGEKIFKDYENVYPIMISSDSNEAEKYILSYQSGEKYGLIDLDGNKITDAIYEEIKSLENRKGNILVKKDGLYGVLDEKGNVIIDTLYNSVRSDEYSSERDDYRRTGYIVSEKTSKGIFFGYVDYSGKMLVEPKYELVSRFPEYEDEDIYLYFMDNGKKGVIRNNKIFIDAKYQQISYNSTSNIFVVTKNNKQGVLNQDGKEILPLQYTNCQILGDYISVKKDDQMLLFDLYGNLVNTNNYRSIQPTANSYYFIAQGDNGFYSIISKNGQIENNYTNISYAFDDFFIFSNVDGKYGVVDAGTNTVEIEPTYEYIIVLDNSNILEAKSESAIDIYSNILAKVLTVENGIVEKISDRFYAVYSDKELKYINNEGAEVENTKIFNDRKLYSYQDVEGKWGFVDKDGNIKVDCKYDRVTELNDYGFAGVLQENKWGVIDENGEVIVVPGYDKKEINTNYYDPKFIGKYLLQTDEMSYCVEVSE